LTLETHRKPFRVLVHGLAFFCKRVPERFADEDWDIRFHDGQSLGSALALARDLFRADLLFIWGARISMGKVLRLARILRKEKIILFWAGSDVLGAQMEFAEGKMHPWIAGRTHWAIAPWLTEEIHGLGLPCEHVPLFWLPTVPEPVTLPGQFCVGTYMPAVSRKELYGLDRILEAARRLPHIPFELIGLIEGEIKDPPPNLRILGRSNDMPAFYRRSTVYWRPVSHDGLSFNALEALAHGRHVIWSYPFPHCIRTSNVETDVAELQRLFTLHQANNLPLNQAGMDFMAERFAPERIKREFLGRWREIMESGKPSFQSVPKIRNEES
jgi:hypothetical protein